MLQRIGLTRSLAYFALSQLLWAMGMGLYINIWPLFVRHLGADAVQIGLVISFSFFIATLSAVPGGWLADTYDRRKVLIAGWVVAVPSALFFAFAPNWLWLLPGVVCFYGSFFVQTALQAYVVNESDPERVSSVMGLTFAAFPLGLALTPPLGGWMAQNVGYRELFLLTCGFYVLSTLAMLQVRPQQPTPRTGEERTHPLQARFWRRQLSAGRQVWAFSLFCGALTAAFTASYNFAPPYLEDVAGLDAFIIGSYGSVAAIGGAILAVVLGRLADRIGENASLGIAFVFYVASMFALLALPGAPELLFVSFATRGSLEAARALMASSMAKRSRGTEIGRAFGVFNLVVGFGAMIGPYVGGWLYQVGEAWPQWASIAVLLPVSLVLAYSRTEVSGLRTAPSASDAASGAVGKGG